MFGQFGFFGNKPREISVRCCDITHLVYLENEDFISVIKNYQEDYENYNMMKDEINFKDKKLSTNCSSCGSFEHTIVDCSVVTPHFNKFRIMIKHIYPVQQKRQAIIRERNKFHTYQKNYIVRDDLKKVRNQLAQKFMQYGDVDEVSDENGDSDDEFETYQKQHNPNDDREYFLKQKMQFRNIDGEIVIFENENTHNYITDDQQSLMADTLNYTSQTNTLQLESAQTFGHKDTLMNQVQSQEQIPDIFVQRKELKQLSIIKNNPYFRSNSIAQKQSLFRMESLAALSSDLQKEDVHSKEITNPHKKQHPISSGFASASGQTPNRDSQLDNQQQSDYKSQQDFQTQGIYENQSNINSLNNNTSPKTGLGNEYLTQYNIGYAQNTLESTPLRSIDQSIEDHQNTLVEGYVQQNNESKKKTLTPEQLQQIRQKLQMQNEKKQKNINKQKKIRKKKVSIQIEGKVLSQESDSSQSYLNEDDDDMDDDDNESSSQIDNNSKVLISEFNNLQQHKQNKQKSNISKENEKKSQTKINSSKNIKQQQNYNDKVNNIVINENDEELDKVDDDIQQKINKKIMEYQGEKILERKSEQSMQEIDLSSMSHANNQLFTQKSRDINFNSSYQINNQSSPKSKENIELKSTNELKIDIDTLNKYDSDSSQSNHLTKLKNSKFSSFYKDKNSINKDSIDVDDEILNSQNQKLQQKPSLILEQKRDLEQQPKLDEQDEPITEERFNTEEHPTPVTTPTHRRIISKAEQLFRQNKLDQSQDKSNIEQISSLIDQDSVLLNEQKNNNKNKKNFLQLNGGQLAPVQEILTKYSNEDMHNSSPLNTRKLSIQSDINGKLSNEYKQQQQIQNQKIQNSNNQYKESSKSPQPNQLQNQRQSFNYFKDVNNVMSNNSNLFQNTQPDIDPQSLLKKYPVSIPTSFPEQLPQSVLNHNSNSTEGKLKEPGQLHRQLSLNFSKKKNYNNTTDMRKLIAYNRPTSHFNPASEEHVQGNSHGIHHIPQGSMNHSQKLHISQKGAAIRMKNQSVSQNHGNLSSPQQYNNHIPSYNNITGQYHIPPHNNIPGQRQNVGQTFFGDNFSQQLLFHQKYISGKNKVKDVSQQQLQNQFTYQGMSNDTHHIGSQGGLSTPKKRQPTANSHPYAKGSQFSTTFSQLNNNNNNSNNHTNYNSFGNNTRGRMPSWGTNNLNQNNIRMKTDSQNNLPPTDEAFDEEINEYETVSNADLYIYDFDTMKEYKKYYPQHNYRKVIGDCLRTRKPIIQNKSIHNNTFIQKMMQKKKMLPRRLPSLIRQFEAESKKQE